MFNSSSRPIQYPLDRTLVPSQTGIGTESPPSVIPEWQTTDNDERVTITMNLSLNEFVALASSVDVGRDIAYGEDAIKIWDIWVRAINTMSICDTVADCIDTSQAVKDAIATNNSQNGVPTTTDGSNSIVGTDNTLFSNDNLLDGRCDYDEIGGQCLEFIEYMNKIAVDWIEGMVALAVGGEIAGYIAQTVPITKVAVPDFGDLIDWITDEVLTQYNGAYDDALRNQATCLLLKECCQDCELTLDNVINVFATQTGFGINPAKSWNAVIEDLITLSLADGIVYGTWQLIAITWKIGANFLGLSGLNAIKYALSKADPIDPAILGCDPCPSGNCYEWDFGSAPRSWRENYLNLGGTYIASAGYQTTNLPSGQQQLSIASILGNVLFPANEPMTLTLRISAQNLQSSPANVIILYDTNQNLLAPTQVMSNGVQDYVFNVNSSTDTDAWILIRPSIFGSGIATLSRVTLEGDLTNAVLTNGSNC